MEFELYNRHVAVVGLAKTGIATARLLLDSGVRLRIFEKTPEAVDARVLDEMRRRGVELLLDEPGVNDLRDVELVVPSPGVSPSAPILAAASAAGIPIISEVELAAALTNRPIVAVTGTNGKTTTVTLIADILAAAGLEPDLAGNIGRPLIDAVRDERKHSKTGADRPLVVETSSFQLEYTRTFRPRVAVFLNLTPDHADWHGDFAAYRRAKQKIFQAQGPSDWAVVNQAFKEEAGDSAGRAVSFGGCGGVFVKNGWICQDFQPGPEKIVRLDELFIRGEHNHENVMAAVAVGLIFGAPASEIARVVTDFRGVEHRLEFVLEDRGIRYFNDSKATNSSAAAKAIETFDGQVILLAGGRNKGGSFDELAERAAGRIKLAVLFGEAASEIGEAFADRAIPVRRGSSLAEAVSLAAGAAGDGDVVLLSPACASFDMFRNYEERGRIFKDLVATKTSPVG